MQTILKRLNKMEYDYKWLILYLCLVIFTPYINIAGRDNFEITFGVTMLFIIFVPYLLKATVIKTNRFLSTILSILLVVLVLDTVSILNYIRVTRGIENIIANVIPNIKVGLYILAVVSFYSLKMDYSEYDSFLRKVVPSIAAAVALIGILQRFDFLYFNEWFTKFYISGEGAKALLQLLRDKHPWGRVMGTLSNPNFYSLQLIIFIILVSSNIIFKNTKKEKIVNIIILGLLSAAMIFTQSRTALIVLVIILVYIMFIRIVKAGAKNIFKYTAASAGIILLMLLFIKLFNLDYFIEVLRRGITTNSITVRIERWNEAIELFKLHPIVGIGPVIGKYFSAVDNEYIHIMRNYGIIGLAGHLSFYIYIYAATLKDVFSRKLNADIQKYAFVLNCSVLAVMISNITLATFYHWRNFILLLVVCCLWAKLKDKKYNIYST